MATRYMDYEAGNNANDATSFANRVKTWDASGLTAARVAAGDTCRIMASRDATSLGNADWNNGTNTVTLATSDITKMVFDCETAFTDGSGGSMTVTTSSTRKEGTLAASIAVAGGFTTGLMVYKALAGATDFSGYQQICLWIRSSVIIAANTLRIDLCSDNAGVTAVDSFTIAHAIDPVNTWHAVVINKGSALGASIESVAITALLDPGTPTIIIDDIFVSKSVSSADCLTLHSVIRKNGGTGANLGWYRVKSVNGTAVKIERLHADTAATALVYVGSTATASTDVRQCIPLTPVNLAATNHFLNQRFGTSEATRTTYSGGWNRTDMTTQTGETWFVAINGLGQGVDFDTLPAYISIEKISFVTPSIGFIADGYTSFVRMTDCWSVSATLQGYAARLSCSQLTRCYSVISGNTGIQMWDSASSMGTGGNVLDSCVSHNSSTTNIWGTNNDQFISCVTRGGAVDMRIEGGTDIRGRPTLINCTLANGSTAGVVVGGSNTQLGTCAVLVNTTITASTEFSFAGSPARRFGSRVYSHNHDNTAGNHQIFQDNALISAETTTRHTPSGSAWKIKPSETDVGVYFPVEFLITAVKLTANVPKIVRCYFRRGDATNCSAQLVVKPYEITGITSEIAATAAGATDAWEQLSITITGHTVTDTIAVYARVWTPTATVGANVYAIVDDVSFG